MKLFELTINDWFEFDKGHFKYIGCDGMYGKCLLEGDEESLYFLPCYTKIKKISEKSLTNNKN